MKPSARRARPGAGGAIPARRLLVLLVVMSLVFVAVVARLAFLQGFSARRYAVLGRSQRLHSVTLPAERGSILDRNGIELALSAPRKTVWANPRLVRDPIGAARALSPVLHVDQSTLRDKLSTGSSFVYLARKVDDGVAAQVQALGLEGVSLLDEPKRFAPAGGLAEPVLGQVGLDNRGLAGLEAQYDHQLRGRPGTLVVERDPAGREIASGVRQLRRPVRGSDLVLTIDRAMQFETERVLAAQMTATGARRAMAVVMDPRDGSILAMASLETEGSGSGPGGPRPARSNTTVTHVYEPGSVNKVITVAGALEEGVIRATDRLGVADHLTVADALFRDDEPHPTRSWSITDIVANSSNVGTILIGRRLGKARVDGYLRAFGLGSRSGLRFPGESAGILLDPKDWSGTSIATVPIGQGLAVTAVQMLGAFNTIANDGLYVPPRLVQRVVEPNGRQRQVRAGSSSRVVSPATADQVTAMLGEVVRVGTGRLATVDGYPVAGKTGTARKVVEGARGYKEGAYVASFAGFVPADAPRLSAIVVLDEPTPIYGGLVAAPAFAELARFGLRLLEVPPPGPAGAGAGAAGARAAAVPPLSEDAVRADEDAGGLDPGAPTTLGPTPPLRP